MGSPAKRRSSPPPKTSPSKRIRTSEPIIIEDDSDDDLRDILEQIKAQEESEKLARHLQNKEGDTGTSSNSAIVIDDDDDAEFARALQREWDEAERISEQSATENAAQKPESSSAPSQNAAKRFSYHSMIETQTPNEILTHYRFIFTSERPCSKCGKMVQSPRGYVTLSGDTISPSLGLLLHAPCSSCKTNHCRGCFNAHPCSTACKGIAKNSQCSVNTCCTQVRAIALFEALGSFDRQYIEEKAISQTRAAQAVANGKKKGVGSGTVGPGGTGYGTGSSLGHYYGDPYYSLSGRGRGRGEDSVGHARVQNQATHLASQWEIKVARALSSITALLPAPYTESPEVYDLLPHPSVGPLLQLSKIPDLLGDLLRNDSVADWMARSDVYYDMLRLLKRMSDSELTIRVLLEPRFVMNKGPGIEPWMWEEGEVEWESTSGKLERASPLYEHFRKLSKQSEAFMASAAQLMETEDDPEETIKATSLCGDIIATRDDIERAVLVLGPSSDDVSVAEEKPSTTPGRKAKGNGKGKAKDVSHDHELEKAYSRACDNLAFRHVSLGTSDTSGKGKSRADGLHYTAFNFVRELDQTQNATRNVKDRLHLLKELAVLATSLPPGIWMRVDEVRNDAIKILIAGPEGTPYAGGLFEFDVFMPLDYPRVPPQMHLRTTGRGTVRFNPNLYQNGKVCLSLLGTWHGNPEEQWFPYKSTLLQVLVSIQSMILIELPYFNEPGYGQANAKSTASINYNRNIALQTTRWAIIDWMTPEHRDGLWGEVIASHLTIRKDKIRKQINEWAAKIPKMRAYDNAITRYGGLDELGVYPPLNLELLGKRGKRKTQPTAHDEAGTSQHGLDLVKEFDERMQSVEGWSFGKP